MSDNTTRIEMSPFSSQLQQALHDGTAADLMAQRGFRCLRDPKAADSRVCDLSLEKRLLSNATAYRPEPLPPKLFYSYGRARPGSSQKMAHLGVSFYAKPFEGVQGNVFVQAYNQALDGKRLDRILIFNLTGPIYFLSLERQEDQWRIVGPKGRIDGSLSNQEQSVIDTAQTIWIAALQVARLSS